jgi:hypothetical protein
MVGLDRYRQQARSADQGRCHTHSVLVYRDVPGGTERSLHIVDRFALHVREERIA